MFFFKTGESFLLASSICEFGHCNFVRYLIKYLDRDLKFGQLIEGDKKAGEIMLKPALKSI